MRRAGRRLLGLLLALVMGLEVLISAAPAAQAAYPLPAPTGLSSPSRSTTAIGLAWKSLAGATKYRVQYSTDSAMTNPGYRRVDGTSTEFTELQPGVSLWFRVRAITADGTNLSGYSTAFKATALSSGFTSLAPTGLRATALTANEVTLGWNDRGPGLTYRIRWSTSSTMSAATALAASTPSLTISGLKENTSYYAQVEALDASGTAVSMASPVVALRTPYAFPAPTPTRTARSKTMLALAWTAVPNAPQYRIQYSASATFSSPKYLTTSANRVELSGLRTGKPYYVRIRVVSATGAGLGPYSRRATFYTASTGYRLLPPTDLAAGQATAETVPLTWTTRGTSYRVRYSASADLTGAKYRVTTTPAATISRLLAGTPYWFQVRAITSSGGSLSAYSKAIKATTPTRMAPLRVGSYNVHCSNCNDGLPAELPWDQRADAVVATIKSQKLDVVGLQEAGQAWLIDPATGKKINKAQFEDLIARLGAPYKLTNLARNNCVNSTTPTNCEWADQGASMGTKILYNADRVILRRAGSKLLTMIDASWARYMSWAEFHEVASGKDFFFVDAHLEHRNDTGTSTTYADLKRQQTLDTLAVVKKQNTRGLPVVLTGDLNSHKWTKPANTPYDTLVAAGMVDPLGSTYQSEKTAPGATVETRIRTNYASYNAFSVTPPSVPYLNAANIDYIFTTPMRVSEWETVLDLDASGQFAGLIPSDHNLIRATVWLP